MMEDKDSDSPSSGTFKRSLEGEQSDAKRIANGKAIAEPKLEPSPQRTPTEDEGVKNNSESEEPEEPEEPDGQEEEEPEEAEEEEEPEEEEEEDEEDPRRLEAVEALTAIEVEFATLRDQIHSDQIARFDFELMMCAKGLHPELKIVEERIKERHEYTTGLTRSALEYQLQCIQTTTRATRDHLHQQFLKDRHDIRAELLRRTTREWYQVNDERRAADKLVPEYGYRAAESAGQGEEIPLLVAISKYQGFPAAPSITGASDHELERDLVELRVIGARGSAASR